MNDEPYYTFVGSSLTRGYLLPKGKLEGRYEVLNRHEYNVSYFINGKNDRSTLYYEFMITDIDKEFSEWKDVSTSRMTLVSEYDEHDDLIAFY